MGVMSLYGSRRLSVTPLAGVERQGRGSMGGGGAQVGLLFPSCQHLYCLRNPSLFRCTCLLRAFSWLFLVMKASRSWGPVIVLSTLNLRVRSTPFKMEALQSVLLSVQSGDWMVSIGLKNSYLQVPYIRTAASTVPQICDLESVFQFKALVSASPRLRRFSHGSWLRYQPSSIVWGFSFVVP